MKYLKTNMAINKCEPLLFYTTFYSITVRHFTKFNSSRNIYLCGALGHSYFLIPKILQIIVFCPVMPLVAVRHKALQLHKHNLTYRISSNRRPPLIQDPLYYKTLSNIRPPYEVNNKKKKTGLLLEEIR